MLPNQQKIFESLDAINKRSNITNEKAVTID